LGEGKLADSTTPAGWDPLRTPTIFLYWDGARGLDWTPQQAADAQQSNGEAVSGAITSGRCHDGSERGRRR
jgi:hypothetical protein